MINWRLSIDDEYGDYNRRHELWQLYTETQRSSYTKDSARLMDCWFIQAGCISDMRDLYKMIT